MLLLLFVLFRFESKRRGKDEKELGYQWGKHWGLETLGSTGSTGSFSQ